MDRFSRDAGEAIKLVKKLQMSYNIQIVSVTEGITYDYATPGSFFRTGLQLLLAEEDNINRSIKIRGGISTAKAKEGRYIYNKPPFGYYKTGESKNRHLLVNETEAAVVRYIFDAYLKNEPLYLIEQEAKNRGFKRSGKGAIQRVLSYPVYAGLQHVDAFKDYPGGLFKANHEPIIDMATWQMVQQRLQKPDKEKVIIDENIPLRGVLKCHCGDLLTGAASRGKMGKYYYYYKCNKPQHLNASANKAHKQIEQVFQLMSLPDKVVQAIQLNSERLFDLKMGNDKNLLTEKKRELAGEEDKLLSIEEKWINNSITRETYERWFSKITSNRLTIKAAIERLSGDQNAIYKIVKRNLEGLSDLGYVFGKASALQKQELIRIGFDNNLYYENGVYRTPTMIEILTHKTQEMSDLGLLEYQKKGGLFSNPPLS
jgi:site-specific DNA recombinase